jgi:NAD(P)H-dependent flavin oxidoreductase YrpB (nitropropane dioxygenase family)
VLTEDRHRRLDQALEAGLRIVSFFMGDPSGYTEQVHDAGGIVLHTVGTAEEARRAVASGVDVVVAQGWEAGGHVWGTVATLPLVPAVVDAVAPVPVIAAGGIGDARGVAAVLALGAQAAWLGTRFLLAEEMPIHEDYRRRLIAAAETDSERYPNLYSVGWPDSPHRALRNSTADAWQAAGRPPLAQRPGVGDVIAHFASGEAIVRSTGSSKARPDRSTGPHSAQSVGPYRCVGHMLGSCWASIDRVRPGRSSPHECAATGQP